MPKQEISTWAQLLYTYIYLLCMHFICFLNKITDSSGWIFHKTNFQLKQSEKCVLRVVVAIIVNCCVSDHRSFLFWNFLLALSALHTYTISFCFRFFIYLKQIFFGIITIMKEIHLIQLEKDNNCLCE